MDAKFAGEFWESLCKRLGIKRKMSTAYHPQTDGQTERVKQVLASAKNILPHVLHTYLPVSPGNTISPYTPHASHFSVLF